MQRRGGVMLMASMALMALTACGAPTATPATSSPDDDNQPRIELGVRSGSVLTRIGTVLRGLGGQAVTDLFTPTTVPMVIDERAPRRLALLDDDGTWALAVTLRDPTAIGPAIATAWPEAIASVITGGRLWTSADAVIAVHDAQAYVVTGGSLSTRTRAALRLAADGGLDGPAPADASHQLWLDADGDALVALAAGAARAVPTLRTLGRDLGPVHGFATITDDELAWQVDVAPTPGTLVDALLRDGNVGGYMLGPTPASLSGHATPVLVAGLLQDLAGFFGLDAEVIAGEPLVGVLTGELVLSPGGVAVGMTHSLSVEAFTRVQGSFGTASVGVTSEHVRVSVVRPMAAVPGGLSMGLDLILPLLPAPPPQLDRTMPTDVNDDVPWSFAYKEARSEIELAQDAAERADAVLRDAIERIHVKRLKLVGPLVARFTAGETGLRAVQHYRPTNGMNGLRATLADLDAVLAPDLAHHAHTHAVLRDARAAAVRIRAAEVAAWDRADASAATP